MAEIYHSSLNHEASATNIKLLNNKINKVESNSSALAAYSNAKMLNNSIGSIPYKSSTHLAGCAEYVNSELLKVYNIRNPKYFLTKEQLKDHYGIIGDAWTLYHNIVSHGGKKICNIFPTQIDPKIKDSLGESPRSITTNNKLLHKAENIFHRAISKADDLIQDPITKVNYLREAIASYRKPLLSHKQLIRNNLHIGDVVGLYYAASGSQIRSYRDSLDGTFNTHVGYVTGITELGVPIISHNIHGVVYNQTLDELWDTPVSGTNKCAITWAVRPSFVS